MSVVDAIAGLQTLAFAAPFNELPVLSSYDPAFGLQAADLVMVTNVAAVPVPAAAWLFGSGLLGLIGVARRRRQIFA
jgi:hypothetical protein